MLVHICCSVDSHFFLQELRKLMPDEELIGYFYDPNIHPFSEYELRYFDVARSCKKLGIKLIKGEYDYAEWFNYVKGYENEPERGKRCSKCFDFRMRSSVEMALKLGQKTFTTTLLCSPKKDLEQLRVSMQEALKGTDLEFFCVDFRKDGGTQRQLKLAKDDLLYHQNYCGCIYGLAQQKSEEHLIKELSSSIYKNQILPGSIEEKLQFFKKVVRLESKNQQFSIIREKFLNYRLLYARIKANKNTAKAFVLFYSHFKSRKINLSLDISKELIMCNKDELCVISFKKANEFFKYENYEEFLKNPPSIKKQISFRAKLFNHYNLSPIIIIENIPEKIEIIAKSIIFEDTRFIQGN
ncbi:epoxyqueuosine reductase QueH [Campylobacter sp. 2018MI13]|uniref:epoxyqueuosine reductase QueH n=1 Tax=Campylobacter sp. 2018MI13 TaxID=2836737 RepID=UPI001BDAD3D8|nr:epoxyqueuosine reductase QueH [Campylobacter sp. 2018MI13]MBT0882275.1 epoxyqueuosine reductase QueH [Campylobacter sp. 2018MI13]